MPYARQMIETNPDATPAIDAEALVKCIEACFDCNQACTTCAESCCRCESTCKNLLFAAAG